MRIVRNPAFESEVRASPEIRAALDVKANEVKARAIAIAPHGPTGMYRRSLVVTELPKTAEFVGELGALAAGSNIQGPAVATRDFAGHMVEWGSKNNPPYAVLRRAARSAGLRLSELAKGQG